jgi:dihydroxyacetone kinase-like predicted kinase
MSALPTDPTCGGELALARRLVGGAVAALEQACGSINDLNVYPVPDGDTGRNLLTTVRAVAAALEAPLEEDRLLIAQAAARAARMGARGSAGVILAQSLKGALEALPGEGPIDAEALAAMLAGARAAARAAVRKPAAGTMLALLDELAQEAGRRASEDASGAAALESVLARAEEALERTRDGLPVLREASVVDAGAAGLLACLRGIHASVARSPERRAESVERG